MPHHPSDISIDQWKDRVAKELAEFTRWYNKEAKDYPNAYTPTNHPDDWYEYFSEYREMIDAQENGPQD